MHGNLVALLQRQKSAQVGALAGEGVLGERLADLLGAEVHLSVGDQQARVDHVEGLAETVQLVPAHQVDDGAKVARFRQVEVRPVRPRS